MKNSEISWTNHTFNPWIGCTKVSPGCLNCYAENETFARVLRAAGRELWGKGQLRHRTSAAYWNEPVKWNKEAEVFPWCPQAGPYSKANRPKVFCGSMCDWLDDEVPIEMFVDLLRLQFQCKHLDWLNLSKRIENWMPRIEQALIVANGGDSTDKSWFEKHGDSFPKDEFAEWLNDWTGGKSPSNVWIGATAENQEIADRRIPELLKIPAKVRFLSCEPLLGPINLDDLQKTDGDWHGKTVNWVIVGGESGPKARPCNVDWMRSIVGQCKAAGVAPFVKQVGDNAWLEPGEHEKIRVTPGYRPLKAKAGRDPLEWPEDLRVQEFPNDIH